MLISIGCKKIIRLQLLLRPQCLVVAFILPQIPIGNPRRHCASLLLDFQVPDFLTLGSEEVLMVTHSRLSTPFLPSPMNQSTQVQSYSVKLFPALEMLTRKLLRLPYESYFFSIVFTMFSLALKHKLSSRFK